MAGKKIPKDALAEKMQDVLVAVENLFILEWLKAGINVEDIRKILRVDKKRVSDISKHMKEHKAAGNRK